MPSTKTKRRSPRDIHPIIQLLDCLRNPIRLAAQHRLARLLDRRQHGIIRQRIFRDNGSRLGAEVDVVRFDACVYMLSVSEPLTT